MVNGESWTGNRGKDTEMNEGKKVLRWSWEEVKSEK
jgi:hypothetical protein